ncbi:MAG: LamG-like jellyroll fold domain-containing protein [Bacteroidota bacterium]
MHLRDAARGRIFSTMAILLAMAGLCRSQQITIPRIEAMPNRPAPYVMRNWKVVAQQYDSLVFNPSASGTYLPLVEPNGAGFGLSSYVGQTPSQTKEAINCIAAVVGASLVGLDKTNQYGYDWVSKSQSWFNASPEESVYLNNPGGASGSDWWYDTMPNIFFYQLYSIYPNVSPFESQFITVADRWLAALQSMGGGTAPWKLANLSHTAWNLATMTPTNSGWVEPEAGGAIAWLLYSAFLKTGSAKYRIGAELAMESLLVYPPAQNPSYELQLPYGAYIAARMNAELGTTYDIQKLVTWCFSDGSDNSRRWGVTVGNWGGYDCSGLIGETGHGSENAYPFIMNTFEQVGALVPLVRYDARFARAIGKWVLNSANAARLFYTSYLPDANQDSAAWSHQYDPNSVIAHESMHKFKPDNILISPYATGDATGNGNPTNFALYGSSHVGIFGGIIDTTNVPMILRLDALKTDYFHESAYPTFLYFNPDSVGHLVTVDAGAGQHDLYDAVSHSFILQNVTGPVSVPIAPNAAILLVNAPAGGTVTYDLDKMLIDNVVVDYHSGQPVTNHPPRIKSLAPGRSVVTTSDSIYIYCAAADLDSDTLSFAWSASGGIITGNASTILWTAPDTTGTYSIQCTVNDGQGGQASTADTITVVQFINQLPVIRGLKATPRKIDLGATSLLVCNAYDPDSSALTYSWSAVGGSLSAGDSLATWQAPMVAGNYYIACRVDDGQGGVTADSIGLEVRDFSTWPTGVLVAYFPFNGNAIDSSGNGHNGTVYNAQLVNDRFGNANSAYFFNGTSSSIHVPNDTGLNFQNAITIAFWMKVHAFYSDDRYAISHGSWQNRWKVSVTNKRVRWTVKTTAGVKDLDSETQLALDSLYNVCITYNGFDIEIYLNGALDAFTSWSGLMATTAYDLTIGQNIPDNNTYGFDGVLDDFRIYDFMLPPFQIMGIYDPSTAVANLSEPMVLPDLILDQNYPNPFNPSTMIRFNIPARINRTSGTLEVFDILGRKIETLMTGELAQGVHTVVWDGGRWPSGVYYSRLTTSLGTEIRKMMLLK